MDERCEVCERAEGATCDRCWQEDGIPLGPIETCPTCNRRACPDCLHEADCCFADAEDHEDDPGWAPAGWAKDGALSDRGTVVFRRIGLDREGAAAGERGEDRRG